MDIDPRLEKAMARFPDTFGLKTQPGETFIFSRGSSYMDDRTPILSAVRLHEGRWVAFDKGTVEELEREITSFSLFAYSGYWHTWSRVLRLNHKNPGPFIELNLTPIPASDDTWNRSVKSIRVRAHGTMSALGDRARKVLPDGIRDSMVWNLGEELTNRLLTEDFMAQIDWSNYDQLNSAGVDVSKLQKDPLEILSAVRDRYTLSR